MRPSPASRKTFLNIVGLENIMHAIKEVFASLYNDRAISYPGFLGLRPFRRGFVCWHPTHGPLRQGAAGVMFSDTESGFRDAVFVTANYGLGETVQGAVNRMSSTSMQTHARRPASMP